MRAPNFIRIVLLLSAMLLLFSSASAHAQSAKALLRKGNKLFSAGDYQAAYDAFKEGHERKPQAVFLRSMAFSLLKLFKHEEAQKLLKEYLDKYPKAKDTKKINDLLANLDIAVQTRVRIESTPPGAEIFIDAEAAGQVGTTPATLTMNPGKHLVILKSAGFFTTTQAFEIRAKQSIDLAVALQVPFKASSQPQGASVHIGSLSAEEMGTTPFSDGIRPGKQTVYLKLDGYKPYKAELQVVERQPVELNATMMLGLAVTTNPPGASVELDGKGVEGKTPLQTDVTPGDHSVTVSLTGYKSASRQIRAEVGKTVQVQLELTGAGLLTMRTDVAGAAVTLGDNDLGETPIERRAIPAGQTSISVSHPGRRTWSHSLEFFDNEMVNADVRLGRPTWPVWVAGGATLVGLVLGTVGAVMASSNTNDYALAGDGGDSSACVDSSGEAVSCPYGAHHLATTGFITAGASAAFGAVYYLLWGRHKATVTRTPVAQAAK